MAEGKRHRRGSADREPAAGTGGRRAAQFAGGPLDGMTGVTVAEARRVAASDEYGGAGRLVFDCPASPETHPGGGTLWVEYELQDDGVAVYRGEVDPPEAT